MRHVCESIKRQQTCSISFLKHERVYLNVSEKSWINFIAGNKKRELPWSEIKLIHLDIFFSQTNQDESEYFKLWWNYQLRLGAVAVKLSFWIEFIYTEIWTLSTLFTKLVMKMDSRKLKGNEGYFKFKKDYFCYSSQDSLSFSFNILTWSRL